MTKMKSHKKLLFANNRTVLFTSPIKSVMWVICRSHINGFEHGKCTTTGYGVIQLILFPAIDRFFMGKVHDLF